MRSYSVLVSVAVLLVSGQVAVGQAPFVDSLLSWHPYFDLDGPYEWTDIPASVKTVTIPAGTAVIIWSMTASGIGIEPYVTWVRPVIGGDFPAETRLFGTGPDRALAAGSWSTTTEGGTIDVKLQVKQEASYDLTMRHQHSVSWTLIVYPLTAPVPAISGIGIAVMVVAVVGVAGLVFSRKRQAA